MADELKEITATAMMQNGRAQDIVIDSLREFAEMQSWRSATAEQCEEIAALLIPAHRNTFFFGTANWPGMKKTDRQVDSNGQLALDKFSAICDSLLTPRNMFWHGLSFPKQLMKNRKVRLWTEQAQHAMFKARYTDTANFASQNQMIFQGLGAYGTSGMFVDKLHSLEGKRGLRYKAIPLGELYIRENHQGRVDGFVRWFRLTADQAKKQFPESFPPQLQAALDQRSQTKFDFIHRVVPRYDWDPKSLAAKKMPYASYYICLTSHTLLSEGGYRTFPLPITRYTQAPGEVYGRSPAMQVLPSLKTLNAEKRVFLKQGHRASDPVLLTADDGLFDLSLRPGAMNKGGMSPDGKPLVGILPSGQIQITEKMMDMEVAIIKDAFLVLLFQIMTETPQMTATEVIERTNEKGILLAPTSGRQQSEYLGPLIERELDLMVQLRLLPPPPQELIEAKAEYEVEYTSPISRAMKAQEASGFIRTVESVKELVNITGDPSLLDPFNFDKAIPAIAEIQAVPESWMATAQEIMAKRQNRAKAQQAQQQIQALPAQAAMIKAQAVVHKNEPGVAPGQGGMGGPQPQQGPQPGGM
jgi:hypothetical protein